MVLVLQYFHILHLTPVLVNQRNIAAAGVILVDYSGNLCTITRGVGITTKPRHLGACSMVIVYVHA